MKQKPIGIIVHCETCQSWYEKKTVSAKDTCPVCGNRFDFMATDKWLNCMLKTDRYIENKQDSDLEEELYADPYYDCN